MRKLAIFVISLILLCSVLFVYLFKDNTFYYHGDIYEVRLIVLPAFNPNFAKLTVGDYEISGQLFLKYDRNSGVEISGTNYLILLGKDGEVSKEIWISFSGILFLLFFSLTLSVMSAVDLLYRRKVADKGLEVKEEVKPSECTFIDLIKTPSRYKSGTNLIISGGRVVYVKAIGSEYKVGLVVDKDNRKELSEINRDEVIILWLFTNDDLKEGDLVIEATGELREEEDFGLKMRFIDVEEFRIEERNPQPTLDLLIDNFCRVMELEQ